MTKLEYDSLQMALSALLDKERIYRKRISGSEQDGYKMGVRACKSALSNFNPNGKDKRAPEEQALFQLSNGRYIMDEAQSRVMFQIKEAQPEHSHPISGTGYSWDESGMAELFSECYKNDTRYCPEAKSWFTYSEGAWRKDTGKDQRILPPDASLLR